MDINNFPLQSTESHTRTIYCAAHTEQLAIVLLLLSPHILSHSQTHLCNLSAHTHSFSIERSYET